MQHCSVEKLLTIIANNALEIPVNKLFRVIYSKTTQCMIVVPEVGPAGSGTTSERKRRRARAKLSGVSHAILVSALMSGTNAYAQAIDLTLPQNGQVVAGQTQIGTSAPGSMVINQSTQRAAINWDSFNIGGDARVEFRQPSTSSVALNRVTGAHPSQIFGQLSANGQVFITNKQGVYFAPGGRVDVGGLVATSHSMSDEAFMAGSTEFQRDGATGAVINEGTLTAEDGGYIALLAPEVRNQGVITARMGTVALAAGEAINLEFDEGGSLVNLRVTPAQIDTLVENGQLIEAPGGRVIMSAGAASELRSSIVRNDGRINAGAINQVGGRVFLGGGTIETTARSEIVASSAPSTSKRPIARPQDAEIYISGDSVEIAGALDVKGDVGGTIVLEGDAITLAASSGIVATGTNGGGNVLVGGDWQGGGNEARRVFDDTNAVYEATKVTVEANTKIDASAIENGDGGTVVVWSDVN
ncbi:MAG: filamentous hemagglutinin N-terminal domain-containing protein, partial [Marivita sp.]